LDEILVVLISEMGRSRVVPNAGRDHWTAAYSVMLAGGGLTRGQILGSTTSKGEWPGKRPVTVPEILATVYHRLAIDPNTMLYDAQKTDPPLARRGQADCRTDRLKSDLEGFRTAIAASATHHVRP